MTVRWALALAQRTYPMDLVARIAYLQYKRDTCDPEDMRAWRVALLLTRQGLS